MTDSLGHLPVPDHLWTALCYHFNVPYLQIPALMSARAWLFWIQSRVGPHLLEPGARCTVIAQHDYCTCAYYSPYSLTPY
jgi:hypothetical protein